MKHMLSALLAAKLLKSSATANNYSHKLIRFSIFWKITSTKTLKTPANTLMQKSFAAQVWLYNYSDTNKRRGTTERGTVSPKPINSFLRPKSALLRTKLKWSGFILVLLVKLPSQNFLFNPSHFPKASVFKAPTQVSSRELKFGTRLSNMESSCLNLSGQTTDKTIQWKHLKAKWAMCYPTTKKQTTKKSVFLLLNRTAIWNHISVACFIKSH